MLYTLHVRVVEADDIPRMDSNATDAYCVLATSSETRTTNVVQNSMHPRWHAEFHFNITTPSVGSLRVTMRDRDAFKDDNISSIDIQLCSLPFGQVVDQWYSMVPFNHVRKGGRLHLVLHMAQAGQPPFVPSYGAAPGYPAAPGYAAPAPGYVAPAPGYAAPAYPQPAYGAPPPAYGAPPPAYPPAYGAPPPAYPPQPGYPGYPPPGYPPRY